MDAGLGKGQSYLPTINYFWSLYQQNMCDSWKKRCWSNDVETQESSKKTSGKKLQNMLQYLETNEEFYKHKRRHGKKMQEYFFIIWNVKEFKKRHCEKYTQQIEKESSTWFWTMISCGKCAYFLKNHPFKETRLKIE